MRALNLNPCLALLENLIFSKRLLEETKVHFVSKTGEHREEKLKKEVFRAHNCFQIFKCLVEKERDAFCIIT